MVDQSNNLVGRPLGQSRYAKTAALIYGGISLAAALVFWATTTFVGSYPAVARFAGAAWVFVLLMIVLMPIVIPRVRARWGSSEKGGQNDQER